jgi:hypothetical protein
MSTLQPRIPGNRALASDKVDVYSGYIEDKGVGENIQHLIFPNRPPRSEPGVDTRFDPLLNKKGGPVNAKLQHETQSRINASRQFSSAQTLRTIYANYNKK